MEACLKAGNAEAHFIEEVKQYFALDQPKKGLKHLKFSAKNNHDLGTYFYANLLMITGEHEEGMTFMDLFNWRTNITLRDVPIVKRPSYGTNMILIMPPRICMLKGKEDRCNVCYYYKQMQMFLDMIT
ncbi:hypothetical protein Bca52824_040449 [Brassica carinata]|uniref:At2g35280-like TPR domain-containing protein n=1 Tax=Brassica carinata TaxID=52824 RepID=A0A8X7RT17_BRACI|nr:hypothetical protein Bca52824_040449 [Brassica carinata]